MAVVPTILPALDAIRAIGGILGLRPFNVYVRRRQWSGARPGLGAMLLDETTQLVNQGADGSLQPVRVKQLSRREVITSGGMYTGREIRVGPMTPSYVAGILAAGGQDDKTIDPAPTGGAAEVIWLISANDGGTHGVPQNGIVCEKLSEEATALHYYATLRATARSPGG